MNASATPASAHKIGANQCLIAGRIESLRRHEQTRYTTIVTPAPDPYSRPQTVQVRSRAALGQRGDDVQVLCKVGGYTRKPFRALDKETGETTMVTPVDLTLDAIES